MKNKLEVGFGEKKETEEVNMKSLIEKGILKLAEKPKDNPENLNFPVYTISLIEHDYPAKTPVMWNSVYRKFNISAGNIMAIGDTKNIQQIFEVFKKDPKYLGGGVGVGFKDEVIEFLDEIDPIAKEIGAVNFMVKTPEGKLRGFNTDGVGYAVSLEEVFGKKDERLENKKAVILGSGGTGNAIAFMLADKGMRLVILNRTTKKAEALTDKINRYFNFDEDKKARFGGEDLIEREVVDADAVINVSTKGTSGDFENYSALALAKIPVTEENIKENIKESQRIFGKISKKAIISDIVLRSGDTPFINFAKSAGFEVLDGTPMVIYQGVEAFWLLHRRDFEEKGIAKQEVLKTMKEAAGFVF